MQANLAYGQYESSYDDPIERQVAMQRALQNDGPYKYIKYGHYENNIYGPAPTLDKDKIAETILNACPQQPEQQEQQEQQNEDNKKQVQPQRVGGIQFSTEVDPRYLPQKKSAEQIQREREIAEAKQRQRFEEERRRAAEEARRKAEWLRREEEKLRREYERKEREYQQIHNQEAQEADAIYQRNAAKVDYNSNEGRENMYRYHVAGTERRPSEYKAAPTTIDPSSIIPQREYKTKNTTALNGNEKVMAQTKNWQASADSLRAEAKKNPEPPCVEDIEVAPIANGCGAAGAGFWQLFATKTGQLIDATLNTIGGIYNPVGIIEEYKRLDNEAGDPHDIGYYNAKNVQDKLWTDVGFFLHGGHVMSIATTLYGWNAWYNSMGQREKSEALATTHPEISFDPNTHYLKKVRKCGSQNRNTK